jgi:hypothetical protein
MSQVLRRMPFVTSSTNPATNACKLPLPWHPILITVHIANILQLCSKRIELAQYLVMTTPDRSTAACVLVNLEGLFVGLQQIPPYAYKLGAVSSICPKGPFLSG